MKAYTDVNTLSPRIFFILMFALLPLLFLVSGCTTTEENGPEVKARSTQVPDQEAWPFYLNFTKDGKPSAKIKAAHMASFNKGQNYILDSVQVDFFNTDGSHTSLLLADSAFINEKSNMTTARQNVSVVSDSGITLLTEELHYDRNELKIFTDKPVIFITAQDTIYGEGFESDHRMENWSMKKTTGVSHRKIDKKKDGS